MTRPNNSAPAQAEGSDAVSALMRVLPQDALIRLIPESVRETFGLASGKLLGTVRQANGITTTTFAGSDSCRITVSQDGDALEIKGDCPEELLFKVELRDRRRDGQGARGKRSPLNHFTVNHEVANGLPHPRFKAAEVSVYSYQRGRFLPPGDLRDFVCNPDPFMFTWDTFDPERFFPLWRAAFQSGNAPWQPAPPIKGFAHWFIERAAALLAELGFHQAEAACGWYNDVKFFQKNGYAFVDSGHMAYFALLEEKLRQLEHRECARLGRQLQFNDRQRAWWVALQNIPALYLSNSDSPYFAEFSHCFLDGMHWFNSPSDSDWCSRMALALNPFKWPGE